jgi:hypothetical protein
VNSTTQTNFCIIFACNDFKVVSNSSFTGTRLVSNHPVNVFSGAKKVAVKDTMTGSSSDHLVEQMMPVDTWGKDFFTISTPDRTVGDYFKIVASEDNTEISLGGKFQ